MLGPWEPRCFSHFTSRTSGWFKGTETGGVEVPDEHAAKVAKRNTNEVLAPRNKKGYMIPIHLFLQWAELTAAGKEHATV
jgi:hypothetical protein